MLSGPKGAGKTTLAERLPGLLPDLTRRGVAGAERDPLARRATCRRAGRWSPGRRSGRRTTRRPRPACSAAAPAGSTPARSAGRTRRAVPRRVPAVQRRHHRGAAPAAGERRGDDRPRRRGRDLPGPDDGRDRLQPVPVRRLPPGHPGEPLHLHRGAPPRATARSSAARSTDRIDIVRHVEPVRRYEAARPARPARADRRGPGPGEAARGAAGRALRRHRLAAQRRRPRARRCAARWPLHRRGPPAARRERCSTAGSPAAGPPGCTGWPGRSPTSRGVACRPGLDEVDVAAAAPLGRAAAGASPEALRDARPTAGRARGRRGAAGPGRAEPARRAGRPAAGRGCVAGSARSEVYDRLRDDADAAGAAQRRRPRGCAGSTRPRCSPRPPRVGIRFVVPGDAEWPDGLDDLATVRAAQRPRRRAAGPVGARAARPGRGAAERSVAVVGSRSATTYGTGVAGELAADLAGARASRVVSGAAFGIDQAAHRGALAGARPDGRGAGLRGGPGLPGRPPRPARPHRRDRRRSSPSCRRAARRPGSGSSARNRLIAALSHGHRRGRGGGAQRRAEHRQLGRPAQPGADGRARAGHQRAVRGRARAAPHRRRRAGHPRRARARAGLARPATYLRRRPAAGDRSRPADRPGRAGARRGAGQPGGPPTRSPGPPASHARRRSALDRSGARAVAAGGARLVATTAPAARPASRARGATSSTRRRPAESRLEPGSVTGPTSCGRSLEWWPTGAPDARREPGRRVRCRAARR